MRILFFALLLCSAFLRAQDTVVLKDNSKVILNVLHITNDDVVYTKPNKDRSYFLSFSKVNYIIYRNGSRTNIDSIYATSYKQMMAQLPPVDSAKIDEFGGVKRRRNMEMYKKGETDARDYYGYNTTHRGRARLLNTEGQISIYYNSELDLYFPDRELFKNGDYRAGYLTKTHQLRVRNFLYISGAIVTCAVLFIVVAFANT